MKTVLITGASSGIGEATARYFLSRGWRVAATARKPETLGAWSRVENVIPLLWMSPVQTLSGRQSRMRCNAWVPWTSWSTMQALARQALWRRYLCRKWSNISQTNFFGPVRMIQGIVPIFREQKHGVIINVSSIVGRFGVPFISLTVRENSR